MSVRRIARTALLGGAFAMLAVAAAPAGAPAVRHVDVLVQSATTVFAVEGDIEALGGTVGAIHAGVGVVEARLAENRLSVLAADTDVAGVTPVGSIDFAGTEGDNASTTGVARSVVIDTVDAARFHRGGVDGRGVDIAIIDTGIARIHALASRVVGGVDLSFDAGNPERAGTDGYGHGTHVASMVAGIAPGAGLIDVRVGDSNGVADVSQVIAGIDWAIQNRRANGRNIRVLNLSFGTPPVQGYGVDPLAYAVEAAWRNGIVVVVSAGNGGNGTSSLVNPATHPLILAVGASDTAGTGQRADDTMTTFSQGGTSRTADVVAPGRSLLGIVPTGSVIAQQYPEAWRGDLFVGSGTSQAAGVISGGAALMLARNPALTPDEVKHAMTSTAKALPGAQAIQGAGLVDFAAASRLGATGFVQQVSSANGSGSLEATRAGRHVVLTMDDGSTVELQGEMTFTGTAWGGTAWGGADWSGSNWNGGNWNGGSWSGGNWNGSNWNSDDWRGGNWNGGNWNGGNWNGGNWNGGNWNGGNWNGGNWNGGNWNGLWG